MLRCCHKSVCGIAEPWIRSLSKTSCVLPVTDSCSVRAKTCSARIHPRIASSANWLSHLNAGKNNAVAPYLLNSFDFPGSQFAMAFDVANTVMASDVHQQAKDSEALSLARINPRKFSELLASLRGVSINVAFDSKITWRLRIEFAQTRAG